MTNSMADLSARIQAAHTLCKDSQTQLRLSEGDESGAASAMFDDISSDLEAFRGMLTKLGCAKAEAIVKSMIQNLGDVKNAMNEEMVIKK